MLYSPFVEDLKEIAEFEGPFLLKQINLQIDKNGKAYLFLTLMDKTGEVEARVWENAQRIFDGVKAQDVVRVAGKVNFYQGKRQLVLAAIEKAAPNVYPMERFLLSSAFNIERMLSDLIAMMKTLQSPFAQQLALNLLENSEMRPKILRAPAAKNVHHAYAGGLVEHVLSVCRVLDFLAIHYKNYYGEALNRDLLLLGGLFHDIGKIYELSFDQGIEYSMEGRLIGHHVIGCEIVDRLCAKIPNFPEDFRMQIKHQILAHHGKLEYGSPKVPHMVEAYMVHMIDDLDSKINSLFGLIQQDNLQGPWTATLKLYERAFLKPPVTPKVQGTSPGLK